MHPRRKRCAFTLLEIVVALVLFGLAAAALGGAVSNALRSLDMVDAPEPNAYALERARAAALEQTSRDALEEGGELEVPIVDRSGEEPETHLVRVKWEAEVFPTRLLDTFAVELDVRIEAPGNRSTVRETHRLYAYRPAWSDPEEREKLVEQKEEQFNERMEERGLIPKEEEEG